MKRFTLPLALILGMSFAASKVFADDMKIGNDLSLNLGYKLWVNSWQTTTSPFPAQGGNHFTAITKSGFGSIPNVSLKYKSMFVSGSYLASGNYAFQPYTEVIATPQINGVAVGRLNTVNVTASRTEADVNLGYMFIPQLGVTVGYKNVTQKFTFVSTSPGLTFSGNGIPSYTYMNGVTFGVVGGAPIGGGFSLYGNGVGGFMSVSYSPALANNDTASYAASELGLAWHTPHVPLSFSLGYKYQIIATKPSAANNSTLSTQVGQDVTQGYILGMNLNF